MENDNHHSSNSDANDLSREDIVDQILLNLKIIANVNKVISFVIF